MRLNILSDQFICAIEVALQDKITVLVAGATFLAADVLDKACNHHI